ncbi:MAG: creatininase family protein, partial [Ilumatobacteraceae bacterium]
MTSIDRYFANLTGPQVGERLSKRSIVVQPLGAIEQHGPHLPLSTDSLVATAVAEALRG